MNFINYKYNISGSLGLTKQGLHSLLKLPAELRSGNYCRHIYKIKLFILKTIRNLSLSYPLSQRFGDRGFADSRLTNKTGIIFLAPAQYLNNACKLIFTSYDLIKPSVTGKLGKVFAIFIKKFVLYRRFFTFSAGFCVVGSYGIVT